MTADMPHQRPPGVEPGASVCEKAGCDEPATVAVILQAADGWGDWFACREHALAFKVWVFREARLQPGETLELDDLDS